MKVLAKRAYFSFFLVNNTSQATSPSTIILQVLKSQWRRIIGRERTTPCHVRYDRFPPNKVIVRIFGEAICKSKVQIADTLYPIHNINKKGFFAILSQLSVEWGVRGQGAIYFSRQSHNLWFKNQRLEMELDNEFGFGSSVDWVTAIALHGHRNNFPPNKLWL
jgi:hypothetical protein